MKHKPMNRSEERDRASDQYAWANGTLRMDKSRCARALATTPIEELKIIQIGDIVKQAHLCGAAWADRTMVERAICFIEDAVCDATIETGNMARLIENFKEAMGYEN